MKIMHLLCSNVFSGAENVACDIIKLVKQVDQNIELIYCSPDGVKDYLEKDIIFYPIKKNSYSNIKQAISSIKPDIIHAHDMRASFYAALASKNIPIVSHIHNNAYDSRRFSIKSLSYLFVSRKFNHIFWVSESSYNDYKFKKFVAKRSSILHNIVNRDKLIKKISEDSREIGEYDLLFLGRLSPEKDPERLIKIFNSCVNINSNLKLAIVGSGLLEDSLKELSKKLNISDKVCFFGYQANPYKILDNSKILIMTSKWEGMPISALEAMAMGKPIISTPVDGLKDIIKNDYNGYLSAKDNEIVEKILYICENESFYNKLSDNQLKEFDIINSASDFVTSIYSTYKSII